MISSLWSTQNISLQHNAYRFKSILESLALSLCLYVKISSSFALNHAAFFSLKVCSIVFAWYRPSKFVNVFKSVQNIHFWEGRVGVCGQKWLIPTHFQHFRILFYHFPNNFWFWFFFICSLFEGCLKIYVLYTCENVDFFFRQHLTNTLFMRYPTNP